jgi:hypothetical protein
MPVVILDQLSMHIGELFDLSKIPWDNSPRNIKILNETMAYYTTGIETLTPLGGKTKIKGDQLLL